MAENLKTTEYKDGTSILLVTDNTSWSNLSTPGYCWYNNDLTTYKDVYGALYNWYTVQTNKLCPTGWHVPSTSEWSTLTTYLGGETVAGGKLKESGTLHWAAPITGATNETGFTAVPGGCRDLDGYFGGIGYGGYWWSSTVLSTTQVWSRQMSNGYSFAAQSNESNKIGFSVRCISGELSPPTLTTTAISGITSISASAGGIISSDGGSSVTVRGVCWNTLTNPTTTNNKTSDGTGSGSYTSAITGLIAGITYYLRAYATNSSGTVYGNELSFTTSSAAPSTVTDVDGNVYSTVTIVTQVRMASNLKTTNYNDGIAIPLVTDNTGWANLSNPGYCWYYNDATTYKSSYGALYNWYTVNTGKLCPTGWHVPIDAEWTILITYLGGESVAGGKLKETGMNHWLSPNTGATNTSGFAAVGGGYRLTDGVFLDVGDTGVCWSATVLSTTQVWCMDLHCYSNSVKRYDHNIVYGFSVRC